MSSNSNWQDRRGMFQTGKVLHESSGRKASFPETGSISNAVRRASTSSTGSKEGDKPQSPVGGSFPTASGRRRSSANQGGLFSGLTNMKRGSEDYGERKASHAEMTGSGSGVLGGWFNSTFKGAQKPAGDAQNTQQK